MKIRESGMPEELYWESFFDVNLILSKLELNKSTCDIVEFGSGYGTFTIPAAKIIEGNIYAYDIDPVMIERLNNRILTENISNVKVTIMDFVKEGTGLNDSSIDFVMLFNILHAEDPDSLLNEAHRILRANGKLGIIHWIYSESTPRGPSLDIRPKPEHCLKWLKDAGFESVGDIISLPPFHYGIKAIKK